MTRTFVRLLASILLVGLMAAGAWAALAKTYVVLPFAYNGPEKYKHIGKGAQSMLSSRLNWREHFEPGEKSGSKEADAAAPASKVEASKLMDKLGTDFLVYGSFTVIEPEASVDLTVQSRDGNTWTESQRMPVDTIIPGLERMAQSIRGQLFERPGDKAKAEKEDTSKPQDKAKNVPVNPDIIVGETGQSQLATLNPRFRYEGSPQTPGRWRSQALPFASNAMAVGDLDGDGKTEIVIVSDSAVRVYRNKGTQLELLGELKTNPRRKLVNVGLIDTTRSGVLDIVVAGHQDEAPKSMVLNFKGGKLTIKDDNIPMYLSVVRIPPNFQPTLLGQKSGGPGRMFQGGGVGEVIHQGGQYTLGKMLQLPELANVFSIAYLPIKGEGYKVINIDSSNRITVYTEKLDLQSKSQDTFCSSAIALEEDQSIAPGLGKPRDALAAYYYVPVKPVVAALNQPDQYELLVNKDISVAAQIFDRFRNFSQGEVHSLFWDGVGMNLFWKTRRIQGAVTGVDVGDVNNDGKKDLVICVNTYPGATGLENRKTIILGYDLNMDPNALGAPAADGQ